MTASRVKLAPRRPILWLWASLTALFVVCAYVIALALGLGCAALTLTVFRSPGYGTLALSLSGCICGTIIFWSFLPGRGKFVPPGPALDAATQPRLFAEISHIAAAFDEPMPAAVYLTCDANAWVGRRGGMLGFGSRRVMALGLPLLSVLTVAELRAVLAHEFAHYYGGDTGLGPWILRARETLGRSLSNLAGDWGSLNFLSKWAVVAFLRLAMVLLLAGYWRIFLRLTLLVSRQWEYRADELACAVAGAQPLVNGLRKIEGASWAWPLFWRGEAMPVLRAGFAPPLGSGFSHYLAVPAVAERLAALVSPALESQKPQAFHTHPTFRQRTARALSYPFDNPPQDDSSALALVDRTTSLEYQAAKLATSERLAAKLKPIEWEDAASMMLPLQIARLVTYRHLLNVYTLADLPEAVRQLPKIASQMRDPKGMLLSREQRLDRAASLLSIALTLSLMGDGWQAQSRPGESGMVRGDRVLLSGDLIAKLRSGAMTEAAYRQVIADIGAGELPLAPK